MTRLRIALEWFLNPDHLPLIAAREKLRGEGVDLELVVPDDHYDGFEALARGYLETAGAFLEPRETGLLAFAGKLITLEIGIRFLTDYLEGDLYFKTKRPDHNLDRLRTQLALVKSIEEQEGAMENLVREVAK